jgi:hypothetical protein
VGDQLGMVIAGFADLQPQGRRSSRSARQGGDGLVARSSSVDRRGFVRNPVLMVMNA